MILFKAVDKCYISGRGNVYTGKLPLEEQKYLTVGSVIQIDFNNNIMVGEVKGIERFAVPENHPARKNLGILFKENVASKKETTINI